MIPFSNLSDAVNNSVRKVCSDRLSGPHSDSVVMYLVSFD